MIKNYGHGVLKPSFFHSRVIPIISLCLIVGLGPVTSVLLVLQKTNNVVVRCHLCWVPFLRGSIFEKKSALFVTLCQWVLQMLRAFDHFDQAPLLDISGCVAWPYHILQFAEHQFMEHAWQED